MDLSIDEMSTLSINASPADEEVDFELVTDTCNYRDCTNKTNLKYIFNWCHWDYDTRTLWEREDNILFCSIHCNLYIWNKINPIVHETIPLIKNEDPFDIIIEDITDLIDKQLILCKSLSDSLNLKMDAHNLVMVKHWLPIEVWLDIFERNLEHDELEYYKFMHSTNLSTLQ